jgi:hypothetical protein
VIDRYITAESLVDFYETAEPVEQQEAPESTVVREKVAPTARQVAPAAPVSKPPVPASAGAPVGRRR